MTTDGRSVEGNDDGRVIALDDDDADELFEVLSSERHRTVLRSLQADPATTDELAARLDVPAESVQVAVDRLEAAGLVESTDATDPAVGETATVYAPTDESVVRYGDGPIPERRVHVRRLLVAGVVLAAASVALHVLAGSTGQGVPPSLLFFAGGVLVLFGWAGYRATIA